MVTDPHESLLVFSDVHLGSDLHESVSNKGQRSLDVDRDLVQMLQHYRSVTPPADRWRIVIAGDFIDFIGMAIDPTAALETELTDEERRHGLGSAVDHARLKLARVAERHADVFEALALFVADGHALTLVHGNHDIELHWDAVKDDFRALLAAAGRPTDPDEFAARIEFNPWFFYRDGVAYIEHGHQYDPFCATQNIMAPVSPLDTQRVARGFCDTLIRFVVRTTHGMKEHGHDHTGMAFYVSFGFRLGLSGMVKLGMDFIRAIREMFRLREGHLSETARILRLDHEERVTKLATATRLGVERLRALIALQARPITSSVRGIMASVLLDRLAVGILGAVALVGIAFFGNRGAAAAWSAGGVIAACVLLNVKFSRLRTVDASARMTDRATHLAQLFPAAFVVMGHTHIPFSVAAGDARYINVGSWAEELGEDYRAARTHLVIHVKDDRPEAHFYAWASTGPEPVTIG